MNARLSDCTVNLPGHRFALGHCLYCAEPQPRPAPMPEQQLAEIREGRYQVRSMATVDVQITALLAEVERLRSENRGHVQHIASLLTSLNREEARVAELETERDGAVVADFFQPGRTYTRDTHGRAATYRVTHITTSPDGERCATGWHRVEGYDSWHIWTDDDFHAWTEAGDQPC